VLASKFSAKKPGPSAAAWLKKTAGPLAAQRYVATSVATGWLRLWFATTIGSMVAAAVATHLRLQALAPGSAEVA
jgi:hypothetical protein